MNPLANHASRFESEAWAGATSRTCGGPTFVSRAVGCYTEDRDPARGPEKAKGFEPVSLAPMPVTQPLRETTEVDLLLQVARQDRDAFSELYDRLSGVLFTTALRILKDPKDAEDVLQDVFLQIWRRAGEFDPHLGKPVSWAITLTRNRAIDRLRSSQRRFQLVQDVQEESSGLEEPAQSLSQSVEVNENSALVRSALGSLPQEQRQAIEMAFFGGLTQTEVAQALQQPLGTIKARIRRGMLKLRETLGDNS